MNLLKNEKSKQTAPIFDIQHLSTHDGPGMRTLVFFKGCPLSCTWCSNPESQSVFPRLKWVSSKCKSCFSCIENCPVDAVSIKETEEGKQPDFDRSLCSRCKEHPCVDYCLNDALSIVGRDITVDELFNILKKETRLYWNTGGGVTFSGGEPLLYPEFIKQVTDKLKSLSINTAIETCGYWEYDRVKEIIEQVDLIYFDIKTLCEKLHKQFTGKSNKKILSNLEIIAGEHQDKIIVSIPVIPGVMDNINDLRDIGNFLVRTGIKKTRLLPYHRLSLGKYEALGIKYPHERWDGDVDDRLIERMREELDEYCFSIEDWK